MNTARWGGLVQALDRDYRHRLFDYLALNVRRFCLRIRRLFVNGVHDAHARSDSAEYRKSLLIRIALGAKIEGGLVANTDEELGRRRANCTASHRYGPVYMQQTCFLGRYAQCFTQRTVLDKSSRVLD